MKNKKTSSEKGLLRSFQKGIFFGLGAFLCGGLIFAVASTVTDEKDDYATGNILTATTFNNVIKTLKGIYNDGGNVGIGTDVPSEKLDVVGNIKASGTVCDGGGNCIGSGGGNLVCITVESLSTQADCPVDYVVMGCGTYRSNEEAQISGNSCFNDESHVWARCCKI